MDEHHEGEDIDAPDVFNQPEKTVIACRTNDKAPAVKAAADGGNLQAYTAVDGCSRKKLWGEVLECRAFSASETSP